MAKSTPFCPILMIGFDPPKDNKSPDPRLCNEDCAWYNEDRKCCQIAATTETMEELIEYTCATSMGYGDEECYQNF